MPEELINTARSGRERDRVAAARTDPAAFRELYDEYLPRIYAFVARRVEDRDVAEHVTAATFERALGAVRGEFGNTSFGGFLYRVAATAVIDQARRAQRAIPAGVRASDTDEDGDAERAASASDEAATRVFAAAIDRDGLRRGLVGLPEVHRRVILLAYFDDLEPEELCGALGCSPQALAVRLHRALRAVRGVADREAIDAA